MDGIWKFPNIFQLIEIAICGLNVFNTKMHFSAGVQFNLTLVSTENTFLLSKAHEHVFNFH